MISRKLKLPIDTYISSIEEGSEYASRKEQFYENLRNFYRRKWGCNFKAPHVHGVELDFFRLYECVKELGGWQKVTTGDRWGEVLNALAIPDDEVQVARHAINALYMRFLSRFEMSESGNDAEVDDSELHSGRTRLKMFASLVSTESPVSTARSTAGAMNGTAHSSTSLRRQWSTAPGFDKLLKSLLSGLPNEVDFALNVCTLLSHPGPYSLRLDEVPHTALISALVAHCCIFADGPNSLEDLYMGAWSRQSGHNFSEFWSKAGIKEDDVLSLLGKCAVDALHASKAEQLDDRPEIKNPVTWRITQTLAIFRNLSFEQPNRKAMATNLPLLKLLICCSNSELVQLRNNALDTLSNLACEFDLNSTDSTFLTDLLLKTTLTALNSRDKAQVLRALEILAALCVKRKNEAALCKLLLNPQFVERIFALLTAQDVLLCTFTLEFLYKVSELGRPTCDAICGYGHVAINTLINLATSDAASFGTSGLAGMKVVVINGLTGQLQPYHPQRATTATQPPILTAQLVPRQEMIRSPSPAPLQPNAASAVIKTTPPPALLPQPSGESSVKRQINTDHSSVASELGGAKLERVTVEWIDAHCQAHAGETTNRGELYARYVEAIRRDHNMMAASLQMFVTKLRSCFPAIVVANQPGTSTYIVEGLKFNEVASSIGVSKIDSPMQESSLAAQHPLMKRILSETVSSDNGHKVSPAPSAEANGAENEAVRTASFCSENGAEDDYEADDDDEGEEEEGECEADPEHMRMMTSPNCKDPASLLPNGIEAINGGSKTEHREGATNLDHKDENRDNGEVVKQRSKGSLAAPMLNGEAVCNGDLLNHYHPPSDVPSADEGDNDTPSAKSTTRGKVRNGAREAKDCKPNKGTRLGSKQQLLTAENSCGQSSDGEDGSQTPTRTKEARKRHGSAKPAGGSPKKFKSSSRFQEATAPDEHANQLVDNTTTHLQTLASAPSNCDGPSISGDYMCEWDCCGRMFATSESMLYHHSVYHLTAAAIDSNNADLDGGHMAGTSHNAELRLIACRWPSCSKDDTPRSKWSMVTHLQDHHCSETHLQAAMGTRMEMGHHGYLAHIRQQLRDRGVGRHPIGYSKFAAIEAIRRHAFSNMATDITEDGEGPVTKSLRLTSSLILRNLARHSIECRRRLEKHESRLVWMAGSKMEAGTVLAQTLAEMAAGHHQSVGDKCSDVKGLGERSAKQPSQDA